MNQSLTPHHRDLVYQALLTSFWRRAALRKFLRGCGVSENFLATWMEEESKRTFLDSLFTKLGNLSNGDGVLAKMSASLCEQSTFPDLVGWEDSKTKIEAAAKAIEALRTFENRRSVSLATEKEREAIHLRERNRVAEVHRARVDLEKLEARMRDLSLLLGKQEGGYAFQDWFYDLLDHFDVVSRRPYVTDGRQIDGSLTVEGTTYLVELKFTTTRTEAPDVDVFFKKVGDKADNTMGIFVSMSGYSEGARKSASGPRSPIVLLDHEHIYAMLSGAAKVQEIVARVRRHASQTAEAYLPYSKFGG